MNVSPSAYARIRAGRALGGRGLAGRRGFRLLLMAFACLAVAGLGMGGLALRPADAGAWSILGFLTGIGGMFARNIAAAFDHEFGGSRPERRPGRR